MSCLPGKNNFSFFFICNIGSSPWKKHTHTHTVYTCSTFGSCSPKKKEKKKNFGDREQISDRFKVTFWIRNLDLRRYNINGERTSYDLYLQLISLKQPLPQQFIRARDFKYINYRHSWSSIYLAKTLQIKMQHNSNKK